MSFFIYSFFHYEIIFPMFPIPLCEITTWNGFVFRYYLINKDHNVKGRIEIRWTILLVNAWNDFNSYVCQINSKSTTMD